MRTWSWCLSVLLPALVACSREDGPAHEDHASVVRQAAVIPDVVLESSLNPSAFGDAVTFTATISPDGGPPTGTVTFNDGANALGAGAVDASGVATFTTSALTVGSHDITATYGGNQNYDPATSGTLNQTVVAATTTTSVVSSSSSSVTGQGVTLTATVTSNAAGTITGDVEFKDGAEVIGSAALEPDGTATRNVSFDVVGAHDITATYLGSTNRASSTSPTLVQTVAHAATATVLTPSQNPSRANSSVTFSAVVSVTPPGSGTATGTVSFKIGAAIIGTAPLVNGVATFATSTLPAGAHSVTAEYGGNAAFAGSLSAAVEHVVDAVAPLIVLSTTPDPSIAKGYITLTATISDPHDAGVPSGTINVATLRAGPTSAYADAGTVEVGDGGTATVALLMWSHGLHDVRAIYSGDQAYSSVTATTQHTVSKAETTTSLASSANPAANGDPVVLSATVLSDLPEITGKIDFFDGATKLGSGVVDAVGTATLAISSLAPGDHAISAVYAGDVNHLTSTSARLTQIVGPNAAGGDEGGDGGTDTNDPGRTGSSGPGGGGSCQATPSTSSAALLVFRSSTYARATTSTARDSERRPSRARALVRCRIGRARCVLPTEGARANRPA
ncbi:MAG TPA: Ig-like domain-containing protein [Labilithrix sp.]|nr:Ig-like domain-containing protein [Labilithrix sp.]